MSSYSLGVWDVDVLLNLSEENLVEAAEKDCPTCVTVLQIRGYGGGPSSNPHQSPHCELCDILEYYAVEKYGADVITYSSGDDDE